MDPADLDVRMRLHDNDIGLGTGFSTRTTQVPAP